MCIESQGTTNFLKEFEPLIHKTLRRLNIAQHHMDYEDFFQELQIKLFEIIQKYQNDTPDLEEKTYTFVSYAGKGLYWHGISLLRKRKKDSFDVDYMDEIDYEATLEIPIFELAESNVYTEDFFRLAKKRLSDEQYIFLLQLAAGNATMQELADVYDVSRYTVYQWRNQIQERLEGIKDCLKV